MASPDAPAKCLRSYPRNSKGQDYCDIALKLGQVCAPDLRIRPLVGSDIYHGPYDQSQNSCRCSSVFYSMLGACGWCQSNNGIDPWSTFIVNCTRVTPTLREFPAGLPRDGTPVPLWAFQADVRDGFQPEWIDSPQRVDTETAAIVDPTSSLTPTAATTSAEESSTGSTESTDASNVVGSEPAESKKANVGAIAGGTVAGVAVLLLICFLVLWFIRRKKRERLQPSAEMAIAEKPVSPEQPAKAENGLTQAAHDNGNQAGARQASSQVHLDVPDFEPPPYQPSESSSMYVGSSQSGLQAASASGSSYPSEKSSQVFLRPTN